MDLSDARKKIIAFVKDKVEEAQMDGVILGIDGGIDSAATAYLCVQALGSRRVMGLILPDLRITPGGDVSDARSVANELCLETKEIDIARIHKTFMGGMESNRLAESDLRARIRMNLLYYQADLSDRLVVSSSDRSELLLGYSLERGDIRADILPIADLYKTEVRLVGEALGIRRRIVTKGGPWNWTGFEDKIGLGYDVIDRVLALAFDEKMDARAIAVEVNVDQVQVEDLLGRCYRANHERLEAEVCRVR